MLAATYSLRKILQVRLFYEDTQIIDLGFKRCPCSSDDVVYTEGSVGMDSGTMRVIQNPRVRFLVLRTYGGRGVPELIARLSDGLVPGIREVFRDDGAVIFELDHTQLPDDLVPLFTGSETDPSFEDESTSS